MENKVDYTVTREEVERYFEIELSDKQWEILAHEIENIIDTVVWRDLEDFTMPNLDRLLEEDKKYD